MRVPMQIFYKIVWLEEFTFKCGMIMADAARWAEGKLAAEAAVECERWKYFIAKWNGNDDIR